MQVSNRSQCFLNGIFQVKQETGHNVVTSSRDRRVRVTSLSRAASTETDMTGSEQAAIHLWGSQKKPLMHEFGVPVLPLAYLRREVMLRDDIETAKKLGESELLETRINPCNTVT